MFTDRLKFSTDIALANWSAQRVVSMRLIRLAKGGQLPTRKLAGWSRKKLQPLRKLDSQLPMGDPANRLSGDIVKSFVPTRAGSPPANALDNVF